MNELVFRGLSYAWLVSLQVPCRRRHRRERLPGRSGHRRRFPQQTWAPRRQWRQRRQNRPQNLRPRPLQNVPLLLHRLLWQQQWQLNALRPGGRQWRGRRCHRKCSRTA